MLHKDATKCIKMKQAPCYTQWQHHMGDIASRECHNDRKVQANHEMKHPETKEVVKRAVGVINYLARFMLH